MRIAIVHKDRCHARKCGTECIIYCPRVRTGDETVMIGEEGKAVISEELCVGCGICIKKCPFDAIDIVSLPEELEHATHRYGSNGFALYGLPIPVEGKVTGLLGANGIGKSTAVKILSGQLRPNLGETGHESVWDEILKKYAGTELYDYLQVISKGSVKVAVKPQYIDDIPKVFKGTVGGCMSRGAMYEAHRRSIMERLMGLPHETRIHPGHCEPSTIGDEWERNPFIRVWRGLDAEGTEQCTVSGEAATLVLWGPDYDGTHKAWVRFPDGDQIVGGSRVQR